MNMKWFAQRNQISLRVELLLVGERNGVRYFGEHVDVILTTYGPDEQAKAREPTMSMPYEAAQALLQALWNEGFRPNDGEGTTGQLAALQAHVRFAEMVAEKLLDRAG